MGKQDGLFAVLDKKIKQQEEFNIEEQVELLAYLKNMN